MIYKLWTNEMSSMPIRINDDGRESFIPCDTANTDYQQYLAWLAEGNTPEPWQPE